VSVTIPVILLPLLVAEPTSLAAVLTVMVSVGTLSVSVIPVSVEPLVLVIVIVNVMSCPGVTLVTLAVLVMLNKAAAVGVIAMKVKLSVDDWGPKDSTLFVPPTALTVKVTCEFAWSAAVIVRDVVRVTLPPTGTVKFPPTTDTGSPLLSVALSVSDKQPVFVTGCEKVAALPTVTELVAPGIEPT